METKDGYLFDYESVDKNWDVISNLNIGRTFVEEEDVKTIENTFDLENKSVEDLRALRNAVVDRLHFKSLEAGHLSEDGEEIPGVKVDYDAMMIWHYRMSGITAVIDKWIFNKGGMV